MPKKSLEFCMKEEGFKNPADLVENATWQDVALEVAEEEKQKAKEALILKAEQELLDSRETAEEKLEILNNPEFKDFGIRFVNFGEYEQIMKTGCFEPREISVPKFWWNEEERDATPNFKNLLNSLKENWVLSTSELTNWGSSTLGLRMYRRIIKLFKQAHSKTKTEHSNDRKDILKNFRDLLIADTENYQSNPFESMSLDGINRHSHLEIVRDFINRPETFDTPQKFRAFVRAFCEEPVKQEGRKQWRQYQIALIVSAKAIGIGKDNDYSWGRESWRFLKRKIDNNDSGIYLLGAVVIMPEKSFLKKVTELSKHGRELAHPVFDHSGEVRYPKGDSLTSN